MTSNPAGDFTRAEEGAGAWFVPWRFAVLLGLLIVGSFPQVAAGLQAFSYYDAGHFGYPVAFFDRESFWHGEVPLWNPYSSCGIPFLAQWNTMTLYPLTLFYLIFPMPWSYGVFCLGHLYLAGMGMYFLARRWTGSSLAGAVAGAVFAFNGLTWNGLMWANITAALGWMPWVVLAMERAWGEGRRWVVLAALAAGMQLLSGGAEVIILTWLFLGVWWLAEIVRGEIPRGNLAGRILVVGGLAAGLAAAQLLPFFDLLVHSQRSTGYGDSNAVAIPSTGLANYLVPLFHCYLNPQGVPYFSNQFTWISSYYLGAGVVALALLAALGPGNLRTRLLAGLTVFSLLMALGSRGRVYDWVKMLVPQLGFIRFPAKFVLLATFAIPLLAAYGLNRLLAPSTVDSRKEWTRIRWIGASLLGLMLMIIWFAVKHPLPGDDVGETVRNALVRILFFALTGGCVILLVRKRGWGSQRFLQTCLVLLLWFDVLTHAPDLSPGVASAVLQPDTIRQFFKWDQQLRPGVSRALQSQGSYFKIAAAGYITPELDINGRRLALFLNFNLLDHAAKVDGFYPLDLKDCYQVWEKALMGTNQVPGLKDFLGISLTSDPANPVGWKPRDSFLPMVTAGQKPLFTGDAETYAALFDAGFEPSQLVFLPEEARGTVHTTNAAKVEITSTVVSNQRVTFEAGADAAAMVVVAQSYYHPWHAYVDGQPTALWRANYAFQALEVPAGKHKVSLVYEDQMFIYGCVLSLISLVGCMAMWFWWRNAPIPIKRMAGGL
jgi:Bacterial membrane protein YfhO